MLHRFETRPVSGKPNEWQQILTKNKVLSSNYILDYEYFIQRLVVVLSTLPLDAAVEATYNRT